MKKYSIAQFGTFDVENFGDLLFPEIFEYNMEKYLDIDKIILFSPIGGIMPFNEGVEVYKCCDIDILDKIYNFDAIVIGGGDLIRLDNEISRNPNSKYYGNDRAAYDIWVLPILYAREKGIPVLFNSPGVFPPQENFVKNSLIKTVCEGVNYLAVRDNFSKQYLEAYGVSEVINICPDSVTTIENFYKSMKNKENISRVIEDKYVVCQVTKGLNNEDYEKIADGLMYIKTTQNLKVALLPLGYIHNDDSALEKIEKKYPNEFITFKNKLTPNKIIDILKNAEVFIGSSLHGNIVSYAFKKKTMALQMPELQSAKVLGFYQLVNRSDVILTDINKFKTKIDYIMESISIGMTIEEVGKNVDNHFENMANVIKNFPIRKLNTFDSISSKLIEVLSNALQEERYVSKFYFDTGKGFNEEQSVAFVFKNKVNNFDYRVNIPEGTKKIRFDPVKNYSCHCTLYDVHTDLENILMNPFNATCIEDLTSLFFTQNPIYISDEIDLKGKSVIFNGLLEVGISDDMVSKLNKLLSDTQKYKVEVELKIESLLKDKEASIEKLKYIENRNIKNEKEIQKLIINKESSEKRIDDLENQNNEKSLEIKELLLEKHKDNALINKYEKALGETYKVVDDLNYRITFSERELLKIKQSTGFKLLKCLYNIKDKLLPEGSLRKKVIKRIYHDIK